jgi:hypothetical protein
VAATDTDFQTRGDLPQACYFNQLLGRRCQICSAMQGFAELIHAKLTQSFLDKQCVDTAHRDITDLVERGALQKGPGGGRSTSYPLVVQLAPGRHWRSRSVSMCHDVTATRKSGFQRHSDVGAP